MAYWAKVGNKWLVVVDGKEGGQYDSIGGPIFSPDGKRVAYWAQVGNKQFVVVDGKEERQYDGIGQSTLIFSPDGKRVAYGAQVGNKWLVVVDGKEGRQYDDLFAWAGGRIVFNSPDGLHYLASEGNKIYLVEEKIK